jgi:hypothetical protein
MTAIQLMKVFRRQFGSYSHLLGPFDKPLPDG